MDAVACDAGEQQQSGASAGWDPPGTPLSQPLRIDLVTLSKEAHHA